MQSENRTIRTSDGQKLSVTVERPSGPIQAVMVFGAALGIPRGIYRHFSEYLADHGVTGVHFDYRGIGESPSTQPGRDITIDQWGRLDLSAVLAFVTEEFPDCPV